jgi:uncharacterized protein YggE
MLTRLTVLAATGLTIAGVAACDSSKGGPMSTADGATRQITVVGSGHAAGTPDILTADVSMQHTAADVTGAMNQTSERQQAVITALVNAGVDHKDIRTTGVSLQPQYGTDGTTIVSYQATNSIEVKIREIGSASQALALIISTGGNGTRVTSVRYAIDDDAQLMKDARARAFQDAKNQAEQYAQLSGRELGKVVSISDSGAPPVPPPVPRSAMAEAVPLEPGQQAVGSSVTVVWELK